MKKIFALAVVSGAVLVGCNGGEKQVAPSDYQDQPSQEAGQYQGMPTNMQPGGSGPGSGSPDPTKAAGSSSGSETKAEKPADKK